MVLSVPAADNDMASMLFYRFDKVTTPLVYADFQRTLLEESFGRRLGQ